MHRYNQPAAALTSHTQPSDGAHIHIHASMFKTQKKNNQCAPVRPPQKDRFAVYTTPIVVEPRESIICGWNTILILILTHPPIDGATTPRHRADVDLLDMHNSDSHTEPP
mmetsp:Transcript_8585/g.16642  ORF Transcript_8585/g.16642 Transcript_8585/m.16642 type:complete len:110 (+) Transcript_8585:284-613(+)